MTTRGQGALRQCALMLGAVPVPGRQTPEVAVEAELLVLRDEPAGAGPVFDVLLAGEYRAARRRGAGAAGGGGAQFGDLLVADPVGLVGGFPLGDDLLAVFGQFVGGEVALFVGGAGEDLL